MVSGFGTGEIDLALTSGSTLLGAAAGGLDAKMIAALNAKVTYELVAARAIKSPKDLRGKRFGIQAFGGGLWVGAMLGLDSLGLDPQRDNINVLQVGDQSVIAQAIEAGSIDAAALDGVFSRQAMSANGFAIVNLQTGWNSFRIRPWKAVRLGDFLLVVFDLRDMFPVDDGQLQAARQLFLDRAGDQQRGAVGLILINDRLSRR
jgi:hypothetical protein